MKKAPDAFRTISEVAEILETPAHVLRFWESKFYQIRPVKRAGGRRYYRPDDVALINGIKTLLQDQGLTIRGVQRVLQEQGVKHVAALGGPLADLEPLGIDDDSVFDAEPANDTLPPELPEAASVPPAIEEIPAPATMRVDAPLQAPETDAYDDDLVAQAPVQEDDDESLLPVDEAFEHPEDDLAPAGTVALQDEEPVEAIEAAPVVAADIRPDRIARDPEPESHEVPAAALKPAPESLQPEFLFDTSDRAQLARNLRSMPRGGLGAKRDRLELLARRIDTLLERMSEASGAGRW